MTSVTTVTAVTGAGAGARDKPLRCYILCPSHVNLYTFLRDNAFFKYFIKTFSDGGGSCRTVVSCGRHFAFATVTNENIMCRCEAVKRAPRRYAPAITRKRCRFEYCQQLMSDRAEAICEARVRAR